MTSVQSPPTRRPLCARSRPDLAPSSARCPQARQGDRAASAAASAEAQAEREKLAAEGRRAAGELARLKRELAAERGRADEAEARADEAEAHASERGAQLRGAMQARAPPLPFAACPCRRWPPLPFGSSTSPSALALQEVERLRGELERLLNKPMVGGAGRSNFADFVGLKRELAEVKQTNEVLARQLGASRLPPAGGETAGARRPSDAASDSLPADATAAAVATLRGSLRMPGALAVPRSSLGSQPLSREGSRPGSFRKGRA